MIWYHGIVSYEPLRHVSLEIAHEDKFWCKLLITCFEPWARLILMTKYLLAPWASTVLEMFVGYDLTPMNVLFRLTLISLNVNNVS